MPKRRRSPSPIRSNGRRHRRNAHEDKEEGEAEEEDIADYKARKMQKITSLECVGRTGGIYIPPFKLERLKPKIEDKTSPEYQRQAWEALRKSVNGLVNKINVGNVAQLVQELFRENLVRARGLFARAIIRAQMASPGFTPIYASLLSVVNSKLPMLGDLVIKRVILQFRRAYRLNDKIVCLACVKFLAHLVNQRVAHELLALQLAAILLDQVTDDSVEVCVGFLQECGQVLSQVSPQGFHAILDRLRGILHEGETDKRVQYTIEKMFDVVRTKFAEYPGIPHGLDLIEDEDQITHEMDLDDSDIKGEEMLNIFKAQPPEEYAADEAKWAALSAEILGDDDEGNADSSEDSEAEGDVEAEEEDLNARQKIVDYTEQELINLRKAIYLCIMSSAGFEECVHKLLKLNIKPGAEKEVCTMLIDCCAMERTFQKFFALQAERLSRLKQEFQAGFLECFSRQYETVHRLETNKLRNTAKFFGHLFATDALPWNAFQNFVLTEETTTSASRIFIKTLLLDLAENLGIKKLNEKLHDDELQPYVQGLFPKDHPKNIRFSINFFTAIGLGGLTDDLRQVLTEVQARYVAQAAAAAAEVSSSEDDSEESSSESDDSSSDSSE